MRNQKGFTLVELAIVLVIIGIILTAVLRGQDLLVNARAKELITKVRAWEIAVANYVDLMKTLPGDPNNTGQIGGNGVATPNPWTDLNNTISNLPDKQLILGQTTYYVFLGNDGNSPPKNILLVCVSSDCTSIFDPEALKIAAAFSGLIDYTPDAKGPYDTVTTTSPNYKNYRVYGITGGVTSANITTALAILRTGGTVANFTNWLQNTNITGMVYLLP
ncbi:MAG: prepilin-type N-terminal cleavage/methylation domain-containing protein [Nitrospirae bacterium]|nr:prepilin-type N-terminal cleavage/methylation domain-containing protein [Nitrospirota bacterium]